MSDSEILAKVRALVFEHGDDTDCTAYPYWAVAVRCSPVGGTGTIKQVSDGIWFSRESAETHLRNKAHRYPKTAFIWCFSGCASFGGLRALYDLLKEGQA